MANLFRPEGVDPGDAAQIDPAVRPQGFGANVELIALQALPDGVMPFFAALRIETPQAVVGAEPEMSVAVLQNAGDVGNWSAILLAVDQRVGFAIIPKQPAAETTDPQLLLLVDKEVVDGHQLPVVPMCVSEVEVPAGDRILFRKVGQAAQAIGNEPDPKLILAVLHDASHIVASENGRFALAIPKRRKPSGSRMIDGDPTGRCDPDASGFVFDQMADLTGRKGMRIFRIVEIVAKPVAGTIVHRQAKAGGGPDPAVAILQQSRQVRTGQVAGSFFSWAIVVGSAVLKGVAPQAAGAAQPKLAIAVDQKGRIVQAGDRLFRSFREGQAGKQRRRSLQ